MLHIYLFIHISVYLLADPANVTLLYTLYLENILSVQAEKKRKKNIGQFVNLPDMHTKIWRSLVTNAIEFSYDENFIYWI